MSKPSATNCPKLPMVPCFQLCVRSCFFRDVSYTSRPVIRKGYARRDNYGGYCGGAPPLPIPNREVKPTCADGTAMQCGRVGNRLLSVRASRTKVFGALFVYIYSIPIHLFFPFTLLPFYLFLFLILFKVKKYSSL